MSYFESNRITVYPTAYRHYTNNGNAVVVNPEAKLGTEYNTTHLVDGLLDNAINGGNFVVDYSNNVIKFCMQGYYFNLDLNGLSLTNLYVKTKVVKTIDTVDYKYMYELVPTNYNNDSRNLDFIDTDDDNKVKFIGLEYVTTATTGYFPLLVSGSVPDNSWLKFSTKNIGYYDGTTWYPITTKFNTGTFSATTINDLTLTKKTTGFEISGGTTSKKLTLSANMTNSGVFTNSSTITNTNTFSNTNIFSNSGGITNTGSFTNNATTTINKNLTIGANSTYTGNIEIKSKNNLTILGTKGVLNQTVEFIGSSVFQDGNYDSSNEAGSEYVRVGGNLFNIVTRDTDQTISGIKTFSSPVTITSSTAGQQVLKVDGSIVACKENSAYKLTFGNFGPNDYGIQYDTNRYISFRSDVLQTVLKNGNGQLLLGAVTQDATSSSGTVSITGSIYSTLRNYFKGLSLEDNYLKLNNKLLTLNGNLTTDVWTGTQKNVIIYTKADKDFKLVGGGTVLFNGSCQFEKGHYNADNTTGSESIVISDKSFNIMTRDTQQTITAHKIMDSGTVLYLGSYNSQYNIGANGIINCNSLITRNGNITIIDGSGYTKFSATTGGNVYANTFNGNYYTSSDLRLKENIVEFENKNSILDLPIKKFDYIDGAKNQIGCIAQDLQKLYPELVIEDEKGYLSVEESKLVYLLIDEVKKLKEEINQLKQAN